MFTFKINSGFIKGILALFVIILFSVTVQVSYAAELKPEHYSVSGSSYSMMLFNIGGQYYSSMEQKPERKEGDFQGMGYVLGELSFWNVGEAGNSLFGKKDYSKAELTLQFEPEGDWHKVVPCKKNCNPGLLPMEKFEPKSKRASFNLKFSGYANGVFTDEDGVTWGKIEKDEEGYVAVFDKKYLDYFFGEGFTERAKKAGSGGYKLKINIPASAFQTHCPLKCTDPYGKLPMRATIDEVEGEVEVIPCDAEEDDWTLAYSGIIISSDDCLRTGEDSRARLVFGDMTSVIIGPESEITLKHRSQKTLLQLIAGRIWENTKHALKGGEGLATVDMPEIAASIKGTSFIAEAGKYGDKVVVFDGVVGVTSKRSGESKDLQAGEKAEVGYSGKIKSSSFDPEEEKERFYHPENGSNIKFVVGIALLVFFGFAAAFFWYRKVKESRVAKSEEKDENTS